MNIGSAIGLALLVIVIAQFVVTVILLSKNKRGSQADISRSLAEYSNRLDRNESALRDEFGRNREETNKAARESREELSAKITEFAGNVGNDLRANREELGKSITAFEKKVTEGLETIRGSVERKLADIQLGNEKKLDEMRKTVDEKLHKTLETRLGESFKLVSERLELVQKGLGEMQSLASDVGSIKNVLSNVKNKGVLGEYQLGAILEQILTPSQYEQNVSVKSGSRENVEFAVKIPRKDDSNKTLWLPIDAKFPTVDYETLLGAYERGEKDEVEQAQKSLKSKIETFAKDIRDKYIDPPNTTDFGIMFLPFEGLYAEVLRIPGLFERVQYTYRVTITGPTTISAFLNSLQIGFRSLAVEKRTSEIWELLGAVRTEFGKFGDVLEKTREKLDSASKEIEKAGTRSRVIEKKLRKVESLPESAAQKLLADVTEESGDENPLLLR